ncbi:D-alanyl-D-alanine carboxypeptidase family protein [Microbispora sp. RL4-1S]|uniref:D-alanyl-D-alanine carboxypeptidase family protein n=1 Tax=Microbispora oryzae TaxID=2806554 RepID=A0A940WH28_9ACTN|nr:D-alanyl-D-alanine carboxypeptidase family protein [Microbispora oryzae]MBP2705425.1 D-alanyl-D-alanine carboxypeptidase family protein [Microbispora oryzae]
MTSLTGAMPYGMTPAAAQVTGPAARAPRSVTGTERVPETRATTAPKPGNVGKPGTLTQLRRQAQQAYKSIEDATKVLQARQKQFDASQRELAGKLTQLESATRQLNRIRKPLSDLVSSVYQDPSLAGVSPFLAGGDGTTALRAMSDMDYLVDGRNSVLEDATKALRQQQQLANQAQELRAANLLQEAQLDAQITELRQRSSTLVKSLTRALTKLGVKVNQGNRGAGACDPTRVNVAGEYPNGLLPKSILCPLPQSGEELRADAAIAFADLNIAYQKRFGKPICVSDSYRSLADQQAVYYQRPGFAATPGKSNHGLGLAADLCGGVQAFRSIQFNWLEANGKRFGWMHPDWAYHSPFEPWHWEYDPKLGSLL